jgi:hypothetical protein
MNEITIVGTIAKTPGERRRIGGLFDPHGRWAGFEVKVNPPDDRPPILHQVVAFSPLREAILDLNLREGDEVVVVGTFRPNPGQDIEFVERPDLMIEVQVIARDPLVAWKQNPTNEKNPS